MKQLQLYIIIALLTFTTGCNSQDKPIAHDPVVMQADGKYYLFCTGPGITRFVSEDLIHWEPQQPVFDPIPKWLKQAVPEFNGHIWAPDIVYNDGLYYLFYSVSSFGSNLSSIGLTTNKSLDPNNENFKWIDHGAILNSVPGKDEWNAIDPNIIYDENNQPWMAFGSFWSGLKMVKLNDDLLSLTQPQEWKHIANRQSDYIPGSEQAGNGAVEGPFIVKKGDYYYLFASYDYCCRGKASTYNVKVGRSKSALGPYTDKDDIDMNNGGGSHIIKGNEDYNGIGHNSVYNFNDTWYMFAHGYDAHDKGLPKALVYTLGWDDTGWPYVNEFINE